MRSHLSMEPNKSFLVPSSQPILSVGPPCIHIHVHGGIFPRNLEIQNLFGVVHMDVEDFLRNLDIAYYLRLVCMYILDSKETFGDCSSHEINPSVFMHCVDTHNTLSWSKILMFILLKIQSMWAFLNLPPTF